MAVPVLPLSKLFWMLLATCLLAVFLWDPKSGANWTHVLGGASHRAQNEYRRVEEECDT